MGLQAFLQLKQSTHPELGPDIETLRLEVETNVADLLHVKITDAAKKRWEVPDKLLAESAEQIKGGRTASSRFWPQGIIKSYLFPKTQQELRQMSP